MMKSRHDVPVRQPRPRPRSPRPRGLFSLRRAIRAAYPDISVRIMHNRGLHRDLSKDYWLFVEGGNLGLTHSVRSQQEWDDLVRRYLTPEAQAYHARYRESSRLIDEGTSRGPMRGITRRHVPGRQSWVELACRHQVYRPGLTLTQRRAHCEYCYADRRLDNTAVEYCRRCKMRMVEFFYARNRYAGDEYQGICLACVYEMKAEETRRVTSGGL